MLAFGIIIAAIFFAAAALRCACRAPLWRALLVRIGDPAKVVEEHYENGATHIVALATPPGRSSSRRSW